MDSPRAETVRSFGYARSRTKRSPSITEAGRSRLLKTLNRLPAQDPLWDTIMKLGYARVSTPDQELENQVEELKRAGCDRIYREKLSGHIQVRPELSKLLDNLRPGDTVTVTRLDRLARSTRSLLDTVDRIGQAGASIVSLAEPWADTSTTAGKLIMTVFAGIVEFERGLIVERTQNGRKEAMKKGVRFGRPSAINSEQEELALRLLAEGKSTVEIAALFKVHPETIRRLRVKQITTKANSK